MVGKHDDHPSTQGGAAGSPGADEERLAAAEARIGHRLPPSLRSFLQVTDGWLNAGNFVRRLAGTADPALLDEAEAARYADVPPSSDREAQERRERPWDPGGIPWSSFLRLAAGLT
ncbi:hypothetical protein GCM10023205_77130 [Yinghuangia aomiensis]|uniref:Knr4/Smi1-like domain-containing protein n=1 Tax=Yinghuangia aomiensis TaxID=676205 RepID=A0ABP9IBD8_9ACTN